MTHALAILLGLALALAIFLVQQRRRPTGLDDSPTDREVDHGRNARLEIDHRRRDRERLDRRDVERPFLGDRFVPRLAQDPEHVVAPKRRPRVDRADATRGE